MNAELLENGVLLEATGGPTVMVSIPPSVAGTLEEDIARFEAKNPDAIVFGEDLRALVPVDPRPEWATIYLSVDTVHRHYGGSEEGGWWYDAGEPVEIEAIRVFYDEKGNPYLKKSEREFLGKLAEKWATDYDFDSSHRSSMRPRGDDYTWRVGWELPKEWPATRPHYE